MPRGDLTSPPRARCGAFEGPLDLLLEEVRRQRVAIEDLEMAPLVAAFLIYVRQSVARDIDLDIEWLQLAATLIHWKSLSLLPRETVGESDAIRDTLVQQLLLHRKAVAAELDGRRKLEQSRFTRAERPRAGARELSGVTVWDLLQQARELAEWTRRQRRQTPAKSDVLAFEPEDVTIEEMCEYLQERIAGCGQVEGVSLLSTAPTAAHRSSLFLGMLEMVRRGDLEIQQEEGFGPFWLTRRT